MQTITIDQMKDFIGQTVRLNGWVYHARTGGKVHFIILRDGTGLTQGIIEKTDANAALFADLKHLGQESALSLMGTVRADDRSVGGHELAVDDAEIIHATGDYPITPKEHGTDFLLRHRHLHLRSQKQWAIARIRHTVIAAIREFFNNRDFICVDTPIFSPAAGEGEQTLFNVDYFGQPVALAQTGQLYLEAAAMSLGKVYCFGPTFRAEKSKTRRHLTEFWMVEPEVAYITLDELMQLAEDFITAIVAATLQDRRAELTILERDTAPLESLARRRPFVRLSYSDAVDLLHSDKTETLLTEQLSSAQGRIAELESNIAQWSDQLTSAKKQWMQDKLTADIQAAQNTLTDLTEQVRHIPEHMALARNFQWGKDLGGADETIIARHFDRPVFVHSYPRDVKAFYMKPNVDNPAVVDNFDCLAPEGYGEIIGGSMREDDYDALLARINALNYNEADYQWYLDLRRYGSVPHGGFGLGLERTVGWLCGIHHIRQTIAFPRLMGKIYP